MATNTNDGNEAIIEEFMWQMKGDQHNICGEYVPAFCDKQEKRLRTLLASKDMERDEAVKEGRHAALTWVNILLGYKSPEKIRELIERDLAELEAPPHTEAKEIIRED